MSTAIHASSSFPAFAVRPAAGPSLCGERLSSAGSPALLRLLAVTAADWGLEQHAPRLRRRRWLRVAPAALPAGRPLRFAV